MSRGRLSVHWVPVPYWDGCHCVYDGRGPRCVCPGNECHVGLSWMAVLTQCSHKLDKLLTSTSFYLPHFLNNCVNLLLLPQIREELGCHRYSACTCSAYFNRAGIMLRQSERVQDVWIRLSTGLWLPGQILHHLVCRRLLLQTPVHFEEQGQFQMHPQIWVPKLVPWWLVFVIRIIEIPVCQFSARSDNKWQKE